MGTYSAVRPDAAGYNIFAPSYGQSLAQRTGDPSLDTLNQLALMLRSNQEGGQYTDAIKQAEASQRAGQAATDQSSLMQEYLKQIAPMAAQGVAGSVGLGPNGELSVDPNRLDQSDTVHLDNMASDSYEKNTKGIGNLAQAGYTQAIPAVGAQITGPLETTPQTVTPYVDPGDRAAQASAAAAGVSANASATRAAKGIPDSGVGKITYTPGMFGVDPPPTFRGTPEQVARAQAAWQATHGGGGGTAPPTPPKLSHFYKGPDGKYHRKENK